MQCLFFTKVARILSHPGDLELSLWMIACSTSSYGIGSFEVIMFNVKVLN